MNQKSLYHVTSSLENLAGWTGGTARGILSSVTRSRHCRVTVPDRKKARFIIHTTVWVIWTHFPTYPGNSKISWQLDMPRVILGRLPDWCGNVTCNWELGSVGPGSGFFINFCEILGWVTGPLGTSYFSQIHLVPSLPYKAQMWQECGNHLTST